MSVLKKYRKESQFEVFHHLVQLRKDITEYLLNDFGYDFEKAKKRLNKRYSNRAYEELSDSEKESYQRLLRKFEGFDDWFIEDERKAVTNCLRAITREVQLANYIYPVYYEELVERRKHQDNAIGYCFYLVQELQYAIETLPVNVNAFTRFSADIQKEVDLIKGWRKSDNKFLKNIRVTSKTSTNFANVNNNGNANNNNASNSNGVRPDFDATIK